MKNKHLLHGGLHYINHVPLWDSDYELLYLLIIELLVWYPQLKCPCG